MKNLSDSELQKIAADSADNNTQALAVEILRLRAGIREHQEASGHALCWLNDVALWKLLDENATYPHDTLPVREEFLNQCQRYHASRLENTPYAEPAVKQAVTAKV